MKYGDSLYFVIASALLVNMTVAFHQFCNIALGGAFLGLVPAIIFSTLNLFLSVVSAGLALFIYRDWKGEKIRDVTEALTIGE